MRRGFDEKLFLYGEDRDLCWRVFLQGYDIAGVPTAIFYHDSFCTSFREEGYVSTVKKRYLGEYNQLRSMLKNYSLSTLLVILPCYLAHNLIEIAFFLLMGKFKIIFSVYLKSHWHNFIDFPDTYKQRRFIQHIRKVSDAVILRKMLKRSGKIHIYRKIGMPKFSDGR